MEDVYEQFLAVNEQEADCMMQSGNMNEADRKNSYRSFQSKRKIPGGILCAWRYFFGGDRSEGRSADRCSDCRTGLPQICNQREILKEYYQEENGQGFDYAYQYPGMNKVLQAAGRVIRTASDRGIIGLLDDRFCEVITGYYSQESGVSMRCIR